jgi:hypothetical protein
LGLDFEKGVLWESCEYQSDSKVVKLASIKNWGIWPCSLGVTVVGSDYPKMAALCLERAEFWNFGNLIR